VAALMVQTRRWQQGWDAQIPVISAFATPLFHRTPDGYWLEEAACTS
jgi:hypothetical protein